MRFLGYTPVCCSAIAALVSVPTNESKTGEGLVKMRSLWRENTDDSETGSGLNSLEKETGVIGVTVQTNNAAELYAKGEAWKFKLQCTPSAVSIHPHSHAPLQHTWKICCFIYIFNKYMLGLITWLSPNCVCACECSHHVRGLCAVTKTVHLNYRLCPTLKHLSSVELWGGVMSHRV